METEKDVDAPEKTSTGTENENDEKTVDERQPHEADYGGELFDIVDKDDNVTGTATRKKCHEEGLLHRSTHVFLFRLHQAIGRRRPQVEVLMQKRSSKKTVGPGLWDVSVAEHLSVGESYVTATVRGCKEELGLNVDADELVQIRQSYVSRQFYKDVGILDHMFTQTFAALYEEEKHGKVVVDEEEVEGVEWWDVRDLAIRGKKGTEEEFTRWLLIELKNLDVPEVGNMITGTM